MIKLIKYIWQLPQNLLGLIIYLVNIKSVKRIYDSSINLYYYTAKYVNDKAISLGKYIFEDSDKFDNLESLRHEKGHQKQSLVLGPLYLLIIGLPSLIGNILHKKHKFNYYKQPWEHNASVLGGCISDYYLGK